MVFDFINGFSLATWLQVIKPLAFMTFFFALFAIFIYKFYHLIARKDVFKLELYKYSSSKYRSLYYAYYTFLYMLEYLIIFPVVVFIWFVVLIMFFIFISKIADLGTIIAVSMVLVSTIRITAYYSQSLSKDMAKLIPYALMAFFLIDMAVYLGNVSTFSFSQYINLAKEIPSQATLFFYYLGFIILLEFVLRILTLIFNPLMEYDKDYQSED
ncbi:MAG: hypothetical protein ABIJ21_05020 [Nanoarchaeota archaeon]